MRKKIETRKMLLFLPLLVLPLVAGAFYALGGGKINANKMKSPVVRLNASLPDPKLGDGGVSEKMEAYDVAEKETRDTLQNDIAQIADRLGFGTNGGDNQTKAIEARLAELQKELDKPVSPNEEPQGFQQATVQQNRDRQLAMMKRTVDEAGRPSGNDPEMEQLHSMLQSIQEIQNPELAKRKYGQKDGYVATQFMAIPAVIEGNQKAYQGSVVKIRLVDSLRIQGQFIPTNTLLYAIASFTNQRLNLEIKNIRLGNAIIPVKITVFDKNDAMAGINAPDAVLKDVLNESGSATVGNFDMMGYDAEMQLVGAGLNAIKGVFAKRMKRVRQQLKNGYPLLLRNDNQMLQTR